MGSSVLNNDKQDQSCLPNAFDGGQQILAESPKKNGKNFKITAAARDVG
jgi:hypothetical protein